MLKPEASGIKAIIALFLIHFLGDFYYSFINPLLPVFVEKYLLSMTQVGIITGMSRFLAFIVQPPVGYISDHYYPRLFILGGLFISFIFIPLVSFSSGFATLIFFICLGSLGSSMFHPASAGMVSLYAGRYMGLSMAIYNLGGTLAFAVGPLFITAFVGYLGLEALPFTMIIGFLVVFTIAEMLPPPRKGDLKKVGFIGSLNEAFGEVWKSIVIIWIVMVLRSLVGQSFLTFIPILFTKEGHPLIAIGTMVSLFTLAGAISGLVAGHFSDKIGYKPIFLIAHGLATPSLYLLLAVSGALIYPAVFIGGFFIFATLPLGLAMAQVLVPKGRSMVSSLMMGLAYGTGGLLAPLTGKLADVFSIRAVLTVLSFVPLISIILLVFLPEPKKRNTFKI